MTKRTLLECCVGTYILILGQLVLGSFCSLTYKLGIVTVVGYVETVVILARDSNPKPAENRRIKD
jgi:hypothetical protein